MSEFFSALVESGSYKVLLWMLASFVAFMVGRYVFYRRLRRMTKAEPDRVFYLARSRRCSEYDIFTTAARKWDVSRGRIDEDFRKYLLYEEIPFYVRDYLRTEAPAL